MERRKISEEQLNEFIKLHIAQNIEEFQSLCEYYDVDPDNMSLLLDVVGNMKFMENKYKMPLDVLSNIDDRFLTESVSMEDDPTIKNLIDTYKIDVIDLHTLYAEWFCATAELIRLKTNYHEPDDTFVDGEWCEVLEEFIGSRRLWDIIECYYS